MVTEIFFSFCFQNTAPLWPQNIPDFTGHLISFSFHLYHLMLSRLHCGYLPGITRHSLMQTWPPSHPSSVVTSCLDTQVSFRILSSLAFSVCHANHCSSGCAGAGANVPLSPPGPLLQGLVMHCFSIIAVQYNYVGNIHEHRCSSPPFCSSDPGSEHREMQNPSRRFQHVVQGETQTNTEVGKIIIKTMGLDSKMVF